MKKLIEVKLGDQIPLNAMFIKSEERREVSHYTEKLVNVGWIWNTFARIPVYTSETVYIYEIGE